MTAKHYTLKFLFINKVWTLTFIIIIIIIIIIILINNIAKYKFVYHFCL